MEDYSLPDKRAMGSSANFPFTATPGQQRVGYAVDGIPVALEYFISQIDTATVGGRFGLLEMSARASRGRYLGSSYTYRDRNGVTGNISREQALGFQRESHGEITQTNHWLVSDSSWAAALNLLPPAPLQDGQPQENNKLKDLNYLRQSARNIIEDAQRNPKGDCAKLLGKDALARFDAVNIEFNGSIPVQVKTDDGGVTNKALEEVPQIYALAELKGRNIYLNPNGSIWTNFGTNPGSQRYLALLLKTFGVTNQESLAFAIIIHEFLHTTGKFGRDGDDITKSQAYTREVIRKCFPQPKS